MGRAWSGLPARHCSGPLGWSPTPGRPALGSGCSSNSLPLLEGTEPPPSLLAAPPPLSGPKAHWWGAGGGRPLPWAACLGRSPVTPGSSGSCPGRGGGGEQVQLTAQPEEPLCGPRPCSRPLLPFLAQDQPLPHVACGAPPVPSPGNGWWSWASPEHPLPKAALPVAPWIGWPFFHGRAQAGPNACPTQCPGRCWFCLRPSALVYGFPGLALALAPGPGGRRLGGGSFPAGWGSVWGWPGWASAKASSSQARSRRERWADRPATSEPRLPMGASSGVLGSSLTATTAQLQGRLLLLLALWAPPKGVFWRAGAGSTNLAPPACGGGDGGQDTLAKADGYTC